MSKVYIIGHKSPDLDSAAAAIGYANYKNKLEGTDKYIPAVAGEINKETAYALEKFGIAKPEVLDNAKDKNIILVDHNEFIQAVDGIAEARIIEILDHHKLDFKYSEPIDVLIKAWGSSCSIIYHLYKDHNIELDKNLAGLMLSAILVDTVIIKSPTTTEIDIKIIKEISKIAGIDDWQDFGMEIFKVRSSVAELSAAEIIKSDYKDFEMKAGKFGIGQVETADLSDFEAHEDELIEVMNDLKKANDYHTVILFLTDIIKGGSKFLVATNDQEGVEKALGKKLANSRVYVEGIISRKKQVAPMLMKIFDK